MKVCIYKLLLTSFCLLSVDFFLNAQNLILNPSFSTGEDGRYLFWRNVGNSIAGQYIYGAKSDTAIVFVAEAEGKVPNSMTYFGNGTPYIFAPLRQPLLAGSYYKVGFSIKKADSSQYLLRGLCISFKNNSTTDVFLELSEVNKSADWFRLEDVYLAEGGEKFIYLGNISRALTKPFWNDKFERKKYKSRWEVRQDEFIYKALYNIDHVSVEKLELQPSFKMSEKFATDKVLFETAAYEIDENSENYLLTLASFLRANSDLSVSVEGFADIRGEDNYNIELSKKRAISVGEFLLSHGVSKDRIKLAWHGNSDGKSNPQSYHLDRRVQFEIIESK